jgi:hypothetical protein
MCRLLIYQWWQAPRRLTTSAFSMSTRQMAQVASTAAGSAASASADAKVELGAAARRAASARAAAAWASAAAVALAAAASGVDSWLLPLPSALPSGLHLVRKIAQMRSAESPAPMNKARR